MNFNKLKFYFFNRQFRKTKPKNIFYGAQRKEIRKIYEEKKINKILFVQNQIGRGGGKWLMDILNTIETVTAYGERNTHQEAYYRYCCSHENENYNTEFLDLVKSEIISDLLFEHPPNNNSKKRKFGINRTFFITIKFLKYIKIYHTLSFRVLHQYYIAYYQQHQSS